MSQREIFRILKNLQGKASSSEIRQQAKQNFPDRELFAYTSVRLHSLQKRGLVSKTRSNGESCWSITENGEQKHLEKHTIEDSCNKIDKKKLSDEGIDIVNIVSVVYNNENVRFDLYRLCQEIPSSVYNPETDAYLTLHLPECKSTTVRVPASGTLNITGAKNKQEVFTGLSYFEDKMDEFDYNIDISPSDIEVQNIVGTSDAQTEIDLAKLASDMPENTKYDTDNGAALIFRADTQGTIMMYRTGKVVATGVKTYGQMISLYNQLDDAMPTAKDINTAFNSK
jgi:TATA-box binding protein (TBP) (component of TFIID and TFIIIB)